MDPQTQNQPQLPLDVPAAASGPAPAAPVTASPDAPLPPAPAAAAPPARLTLALEPTPEPASVAAAPAALPPAEVRVLGCLIEKAVTTPEYYPLTLNALTNACNQKSNRDPAVEYDDRTVVRALDGLRERKLAWLRAAAGSRVPKYEHRAGETLGVQGPEAAVLCELMLRGPQTVGELRTRASRLHAFTEPAEVERALEALANRPQGALVARLPRLPGRKEHRYGHLLSGPPEVGGSEVPEPPPEAATLAVRQEESRVARLEAEVEALRHEVGQLQEQFAQFRAQFE